MSNASENKALVTKAVTEAFVNLDISAVDRYWSPNYIQHSSAATDGLDGPKAFLEAVKSTIKYRFGLVMAEGDYVMLYGRYEGLGEKPLVATSIFRIEDGRLAEHWEVLQEEVSNPPSGNPQFTVIARV